MIKNLHDYKYHGLVPKQLLDMLAASVAPLFNDVVDASTLLEVLKAFDRKSCYAAEFEKC